MCFCKAGICCGPCNPSRWDAEFWVKRASDCSFSYAHFGTLCYMKFVLGGLDSWGSLTNVKIPHLPPVPAQNGCTIDISLNFQMLAGKVEILEIQIGSVYCENILWWHFLTICFDDIFWHLSLTLLSEAIFYVIFWLIWWQYFLAISFDNIFWQYDGICFSLDIICQNAPLCWAALAIPQSYYFYRIELAFLSVLPYYPRTVSTMMH